jgi:hypothetical protein
MSVILPAAAGILDLVFVQMKPAFLSLHTPMAVLRDVNETRAATVGGIFTERDYGPDAKIRLPGGLN